MAGMNSVFLKSSDCLSWFLMSDIGLCLNPLMKPEYAAWGSHHDILYNTRSLFICWYIYSRTYFLLECFSLIKCTKMLLSLCSDLFLGIYLKTDWVFCTTSFYTSNHHLLPSLTELRLCPSLHNVSHQFLKPIIVPAAVKSSAYAAVFVV